MSRKTRFLSSWLAAFALAFAQLATAAYSCPKAAEPAVMEPASDCPDAATPNLCQSHCTYGAASLDNSKPQVPVPALAAVSLTIVPVAIAVPSGAPWPASRVPIATGPPLTRFTVLRI